jgi:hypothetical protein
MSDYRKTHYPTHQAVHTAACKTYPTTYTTCLPEDEPTRFETYMRYSKFNIHLENCTFRWFVLYNYITTHGAKNIKKNNNILAYEQQSEWVDRGRRASI